MHSVCCCAPGSPGSRAELAENSDVYSTLSTIAMGNFPAERAGALEAMTDLCEDDKLSGSVMAAMASCGFEPLNRMMESEHVETSVAGCVGWRGALCKVVLGFDAPSTRALPKP